MKNQDISNEAKQMQAMQSDVALAGLTQKPYDGVSAPWTVDDMAKAILDLYDMGEKCQLFFITLGELARAVKDGTDKGFNTDKLEVGMRASELTTEIKSLFKTWNFEETPYGYRYFFSPPTKWDVKIPVEIHVIQRHYKFFDNLDTGFFSVDEFKIPNPFENYWKARHLIQ